MFAHREKNADHRAWIDQARRQSDEAERQAAGSSAAPPLGRTSVFPADHFPGYELLGEVHRGAQGVVYRALQQSTRRIVALKVIRHGPLAGRHDLARFEREVQVLAQLRHPDIVAIHDSGEAGGHFFLVMDFIDGTPLDVAASAARDVKATLRFFARICEAVNAAHLRGVMHRDLKPGNILVDAEGKPHVVDFGLAKFTECDAGNGDSAAAVTMTGQFVGSLPWCSPEQAEGAAIDIRTDVYSLGVLLFQMLTGSFPYPVIGKVGEVLQRVRSDAPARPRGLRPAIDDEAETILLKCLQKEPERRYQAAGELARDLRHYLAGEPIEAKRDSAAYVLRMTLRRHRGATGIAAAFALLVLIGFVVSLTFWQQARRDRDRATDEARRAEAALVREAEQRRIANLRQEETRQVSSFQGRMLDEIDVEAMGRGILRGLRDEVKAGLEKGFVGEGDNRRLRTTAEVDAELARFDNLAATGSSVDLARSVLDEHLLKPASDVVDEQFADQPLLQTRLNDAIGMNYFALGLFDEAEPHLRKALEIRQRELGTDDVAVADSLNNLAGLLDKKGDSIAAEKLFREALGLRRKLLGDEHVDVANSLNNLGALALSKGDHAAATTLFREALALNRRLLGDEHKLIAASLNNLAEALRAGGDYAGAESLYRESLALSHKLGEKSRDVAACLNNLAILLQDKGDYAAAEPIHRDALALRRKLLGDEHPDVAESLNNLANLLNHKRDLAGAEPLYRESLALCRKRLGNEHPIVATAMSNLAALLKEKGAYNEAEPLLRESLALRRKLLGNDHPEVANGLENLSSLLKARGDYAAAEPLFREAVEIHRKTLGSEQPVLATSLHNLGTLLYAKGDYAAAEQLYREALTIRENKLPVDHPRTTSTRAELGLTLVKLGQFDAAEPLFREVVAARRKLLGGEHRDVARSLTILGKLLYKKGEYAAAEDAHREALDIHRRASGAESLDVALSLWYIAEAQQSQSHLDEAENTYHESLALYRKFRGERNADVADVLHAIGTVHQAKRKFAEAEQWLTDALAMRRAVLGDDHAATRSSTIALVTLYEEWHAAAPGNGYDRKAAEWRASLGQPDDSAAIVRPK